MADDNNIFDKMIEMGMGMTIANQIPRMMDSVMSGNSNGQVPPPVASAAMQLFAVVNGKQAGPFCEQELITLIRKGLITDTTLVWKTGLPNWLPANQVPEVGKFLLLYSEMSHR